MDSTETSSSTIEWGMTEILRTPDAYKKIVMELDQVVGKDRFVEENDIPKLPYFQAAVKEVIRLHPSSSHGALLLGSFAPCF
ncbi:7-ethoxycoumarin O-deethylase-like [Prunus yedoensis var. nudiflora]|uniref:7-ethoxycoumarin O-deethylase-like n=1 Tax=Prunus yedoensis var. nudiflora TaxID=2094558 RepID=A0A314ZU75_PRUYE|nr:7-ethoxycoumarin O-deethylase-like [Prunus yedoensis var. nudiflora]